MDSDDHRQPGLLPETVVVVAFYNMAVRVLGALRIDIEPDWTAPLERFPLPARGVHPARGA